MIPPAPPPARNRLNTLHLPARGGADTLLVLLAGAYDRPEDFLRAGFDTALQDSGRALDLLLVESDLAAVCDGTLATRLEDEILHPARRAGRRLLTGGISVGGLGALMHADLHPGGSDGLLLLAPYPGNRCVTREIAAAGGLAAWQAAADYPANDERRGWRALQRLATRPACPVWLGYGRADRFAAGHELMAGALPGQSVCAAPGGHDWPTWRSLWVRWLADTPC